jgi:hypothetical protein
LYAECKSCDRWYHQLCVGMKDGLTEYPWMCPSCRRRDQGSSGSSAEL